MTTHSIRFGTERIQ